MNKKILVVEDSTSTRTLLEKILTDSGYDVLSAENGDTALKHFNQQKPPLVITDLEMPGMDGNELISNLTSLENPPVILVLTSHDESSLIIDIMKKGVFDYILKPVKRNRLLINIEKAFKFSEFDRMNRSLEKEKLIRIEQQLEWYKWADKMRNINNKYTSKLLFNNLQTSFNQGAGFGSLITLLKMVMETAVQNGNHYEIDGSIFSIIAENVKMSDKTLEVFTEIDWILSNVLKKEKMSLTELFEIIQNLIRDSEEFTSLNRNRITLSDKKPSFDSLFIEINSKYFSKAFTEVLINAMKFSVSDSTITVIFETRGEKLEISLINDPSPVSGEKKGVGMEYENIIFEPFFRITKDVHEKYKTLDFGLGLSMVEKIIQKHDGNISLFNITDYSDIDKGPAMKVNCNISIPLNS